jgi:hypothetical protein
MLEIGIHKNANSPVSNMLEGISMERSPVFEKTLSSICDNCEFESNRTDVKDAQ